MHLACYLYTSPSFFYIYKRTRLVTHVEVETHLSPCYRPCKTAILLLSYFYSSSRPLSLTCNKASRPRSLKKGSADCNRFYHVYDTNHDHLWIKGTNHRIRYVCHRIVTSTKNGHASTSGLEARHLLNICHDNVIH